MTGLVTGPTDAPPDDTPWYLRYGARGLGIFGAFCEYLSGLIFANFQKRKQTKLIFDDDDDFQLPSCLDFGIVLEC